MITYYGVWSDWWYRGGGCDLSTLRGHRLVTSVDGVVFGDSFWSSGIQSSAIYWSGRMYRGLGDIGRKARRPGAHRQQYTGMQAGRN